MHARLQSFGPGKPGGGGCGVALQLYSRASVRPLLPEERPCDGVIESGRPLLVKHFVEAYRRSLGLSNSYYEVTTYCGFGTHTGLVSTFEASGIHVSVTGGRCSCPHPCLPAPLPAHRALVGLGSVWHLLEGTYES